jgi:hypothetical protein
VLPRDDAVGSTPVAALQAKPVQDRFAGSTPDAQPVTQSVKSTKTAEATVPTGGVVAIPAK